MANSHFAFGHFDHRHLPGWHFVSGGGRLLFAGAGGAAAIDWDRPVAGVGEGTSQLHLGVQVPAGTSLALGARRVSAAGVMEQSRQTCLLLQADNDGNLLCPLSPVQDLVARTTSPATLFVEFSCPVPTGFGQPTGFEVTGIGDGGDIAVLTCVPAVQGETEYFCSATPQGTPPRTIGVRPIAGDLRGPVVLAPVTSSY